MVWLGDGWSCILNWMLKGLSMKIRIGFGDVWRVFSWMLAAYLFWFVFDGVRHPEKFEEKILPPEAVQDRLPGGKYRENLPVLRSGGLGFVLEIEDPVIDPATGLKKVWGPWGRGGGMGTWTSSDGVYAYHFRQKMIQDLKSGISVRRLDGRILRPDQLMDGFGWISKASELAVAKAREDSRQMCVGIQRDWVALEEQAESRDRPATKSEQEQLGQARRLAAECEYWLVDYLRRGLDKAS